MNKTVKLEDMFPLIKEQLDAGGTASFTIHGNSMMPMLKDRKDSVRLKKPKCDPRKYDIIFYRRSNGEFVLHRIVGVKEGGYICRGDNQVYDEFPVTRDSVIALVTEYSSNGKWQSAASTSQLIYSRIWVNTVLFRKFTRGFINTFCRIKRFILRKGKNR